MKKRYLGVGVIICFILLILLANCATTKETHQKPTMEEISLSANNVNKIDSFFTFTEGKLYENNFESSNSVGWEFEEAWKIKIEKNNSFLQGTGHKWASYFPSSYWTDYSLTCKFKLEGTCHVNFRHQMDSPQRYFLGLSQGECHL